MKDDDKTREQLVQELAELRSQNAALKKSASAEKYRYLVEDLRGVIYELDSQGVVLYISPAIKDMLGYDSSDIVGKNFIELAHKEDQSSLSEWFSELRQGYEIPSEYRVSHKSGDLRWARTQTRPIMEDGLFKGGRGILLDVTAQKRMEEALRKSEEKYRLVVDNMADVITVMDLNLRFTYVSPSVIRLRGYTAEEVMAQTLEQIMTPESLQIVARVFEEEMKLEASGTADLGRTRILELEEYKKDGSIVWLENHLSFFRDQEKKFVGIIALSYDITDRKRAEVKLRESEKSYRDLFENANEAIFVAQGGKLVFFNPRTVMMSGYSAEELGSRPYIEFIHPDDRDIVIDRQVRRMKGEELPPIYDFRIIHKDGNVRWVELNVVTINWKGRPATLNFQNDLTDRKQVEKALEESEAKMRSILDNIGIGVALISPKMQVLDLNHRMREWFPAIDPGQHPICYRAFNDPPREEVCDYCPTHKTLQDGLVHEDTAQTPQAGVVRNYRIVSSPILNASGEVTAAIEMVEDITEKLSLESQFLQSQKMESVGRLAGGVAHDFNNMLSVINGYSELGLDKLEEGHPLRADLQEIRRAGGRAAGLTRQLLAFSRKQVLSPEVLNLNEVVGNVEKMFRRLIGEDVELITDLAEDLGPVKADIGQIEQVLMNLAVNSRDAMPGGGKLTIETRNLSLYPNLAVRHPGLDPGPYVLLAVSDTGSGMDRETQSQIFEPFFTTKEQGRGTGLGLSTVYGIVKQSGGDIQVYSEPGLGTTFKIYLPRVEEAEKETPTIALSGRPSMGNETILVVEDDEALRFLVRQFLESVGYRVITAADGEQGRLLAEQLQEPIHLLLTDVVMPKMNGLELADQLRGLFPELKVLFMSGYADNALFKLDWLGQSRRFISKPFERATLLEEVRKMLD